MVLKLILSVLVLPFLFIKGCSNESCHDQYNESRKVKDGEKLWIPYQEGEERIFEDSVGNQLKLKCYFVKDTFFSFQNEYLDHDNGCRWTDHRRRNVWYSGFGLDLSNFEFGLLKYDLLIKIYPENPYYYSYPYYPHHRYCQVSIELRKRDNLWDPGDTLESFTRFFVADSVYRDNTFNFNSVFHSGYEYEKVIHLGLTQHNPQPLERILYNKEHGIIRLKVKGRGMYWLKRN